MKDYQIFGDRLVREWRFQYGVIKSIADWTIMLYLLIPGAAIGFMIYRSWWINPPAWSLEMPVEVYYIVLLLITFLGQYRTFTEEADKVFMAKHRLLFTGMKRWAYLYSVISQALGVAAAVLIMLPLLLKIHQFSIYETVSAAAFFIGLRLLISAIKVHISDIGSVWNRKLASFTMFSAAANLSVLILWEPSWLIFIEALIVGAASVFLYYPRTTKLGYIDDEVALERKQRVKYINLIFTMSNDIENSKIITRKKPLLYRNSKRMFKKRTPINGYKELFFKLFIRDFGTLASYYQIVAVTVAAIVILPPLLLKLPVAIGLLIVLYLWLLNIWDKLTLANPLTRKYQYDEAFLKARNQAAGVLMLPAVLVAGAVFCAVLIYF
ncbi:hypothetical protein D0469_11305 [Peribacillus saganii]|uniref:Uncharacterized protein n=1 Tax=Peribacillus saganii TaxID=2303992 RepID=A0A372LNC0_9BACI|nr:ABC transporter permease [Peribacillus saganii]RFU68717.1 hypothetical protein D0469_11305 [Peribacillus saganii]